MPTFDTPQPISITVDMVVGDVRIIASDRADTVVEIRPSDASKKDDLRAAEGVEVDFAAGSLTVKAPKGWRIYTPFGGSASVDVTIEAPTGSRVRGNASVCRFLGSGELGQCDVRTSVGDIQFEQAGPVDLRTSGGNVTVDHVVSRAAVTTGTGIVRIREIDGSAVIRNSNGDSVIREVAGDVEVKAANGNITVERARGSVTAKTANGNIRVGDVRRGTVQLETSTGELEVGIRPGSAAWLDVKTKHGTVQNLMESSDGPVDDEETVQVYARNSFGNIVIRQASGV